MFEYLTILGIVALGVMVLSVVAGEIITEAFGPLLDLLADPHR